MEHNLHESVAMKRAFSERPYKRLWDIAGHCSGWKQDQHPHLWWRARTDGSLSDVPVKSVNIICIKSDLSHIYEISDAFKGTNWCVCMPLTGSSRQQNPQNNLPVVKKPGVPARNRHPGFNFKVLSLFCSKKKSTLSLSPLCQRS